MSWPVECPKPQSAPRADAATLFRPIVNGVSAARWSGPHKVCRNPAANPAHALLAASCTLSLVDISLAAYDNEAKPPVAGALLPIKEHTATQAAHSAANLQALATKVVTGHDWSGPSVDQELRLPEEENATSSRFDRWQIKRGSQCRQGLQSKSRLLPVAACATSHSRPRFAVPPTLLIAAPFSERWRNAPVFVTMGADFAKTSHKHCSGRGALA